MRAHRRVHRDLTRDLTRDPHRAMQVAVPVCCKFVDGCEACTTSSVYEKDSFQTYTRQGYRIQLKFK